MKKLIPFLLIQYLILPNVFSQKIILLFLLVQIGPMPWFLMIQDQVTAISETKIMVHPQGFQPLPGQAQEAPLSCAGISDNSNASKFSSGVICLTRLFNDR